MRRLWKFLLLSVIACSVCFGARPMNTDDGRVVDEHSCQIESWIRTGQSLEYYAMPACNLFLNTEISIGGNLDYGDSVLTPAMIFTLKKVFLDLEQDGYSLGLSLGNMRSGRILNTNRELYAYGILSKSLLENQLFLHANIGYKLQNLAYSQKLYYTGFGVEYDHSEHFWFIGEAFYEQGRRASYQLGIRIWLKKDKFQIDCTYGNDFVTPFGKNGAFASIGIRLLSDTLF